MTRRCCGLYAAFMAGELQKARLIQFGINRIVAVLLRHGCIPAIKEALTIKGFDAEERRQLAEELCAVATKSDDLMTKCGKRMERFPHFPQSFTQSRARRLHGARYNKVKISLRATTGG